MADFDPWRNVIKSLEDLKRDRKRTPDPLDPTWIMCYNDGTRILTCNHNEANLEEILQAFSDFCKGAGFIFDGFAIVDEDGIPINGLNSLAKLENDEDKTC